MTQLDQTNKIQLDQATKIRLAAYLHCVEHLPAAQIGWRLGGISQPTVSALLKKARRQGLIKSTETYHGKALSGTEELLLENLQFQSELHDSIVSGIAAMGRKNVPKLYLYDLRSEGLSGVPLEARTRAFATRIVPELRHLLMRPSVTTIGVAWGGMIAAAVAEMERQCHEKRSAPATVLAMCGEPIDDRPTQESSSAIAEQLSEVLNGDRTLAKTLGITPAFLPSRSDGNGAELIWRYIVASKPYVEVFGTQRLPPDTRARVATPETPLCDRMDAFLTSVSIENRFTGYGENKLYPSDIITPQELESVAFGDLGGIPLPRPRLDVAQQGILQRVQDSWTGISRGQLEQCVKRGFEGHPTSRPAGCILLAAGEQKARTVYQAVVKEQLVNHLFLDYELATQLDRLLANGIQSAGNQ